METTTAAKSGQIHSDEEWEAIKTVFIQLYIAQGKSLTEVRREIADHHGFLATPRQYKTRIIKWGAVKKAKNRRPLPPAVATIPDQRSNASNAPGPSNGPLLVRNVNPPGHIWAIHAATHGVGRFYSGVLHPGVDKVRVLNQTNEWNIRQFFDVSNAVSALAAGSHWHRAQPLYGEMLDHVVPLLQERNPIVIICLLQICCRFLQQGQGAVLQRFLSFLARIAKVQAQDSHPLRLLSSAWTQSGEHSMELMALCAQQAVDILSQELGPNHAQTLSARRALSTAHYAKQDYPAAIAAITDVAEIEMTLFPNSFSSFDARYRVIQTQLAMNDLEGAEMGLEALLAAWRKFEETGPPEVLLRKFELLVAASRGELLRQQGDPEAITVFESMLEKMNVDVETRDSWLTIATEEQLAAAKASLVEGSPPKYIVYPC